MGGISKASKGIHLSEDIFAGFNYVLRGGEATQSDYIQVGRTARMLPLVSRPGVFVSLLQPRKLALSFHADAECRVLAAATGLRFSRPAYNASYLKVVGFWPCQLLRVMRPLL